MKMTGAVRFTLSVFVAICAAVLMLPVPSHLAQAAAVAPATRETVRVGMWTLWHDREIKLAPATPDGKVTMETCVQCATLALAGPVVIRASGEVVAISGANKDAANRVAFIGAVTLAAHGETVTLHSPLAIAAHSGVLVIAVTLPVESYVERVVASESGPADTLESLKALAVVVRSFALHESHGHADYDLCDSTHCQLLHWGGNGERQRAAHVATLATSGETLWFHGQQALAYFNKDCGGRTASPSEIWPRARAASYLPSQPDRYCAASAGREWASQLTRADIAAALASHGVARPGWKHLSVAQRGASGRAVTVRLDTSEVAAEDFRLAVGESLGWNQLPSTWFEVNEQGDRFFFHGRGWGHGVGLCQKGAAAMAVQNRTEAEILAQYFPGARTADEATGREWQIFARNGFVLQSLDAVDSAYLPELERARAEAAQRSGLNMPQLITVRTFASTPAFRNATGAPGWVAAFTQGDRIGTQPLRTLASRRLLGATMRHEFLHALVEQQAGPAAPLWLREGLVEVWAEPDSKTGTTAAVKIDALDVMLAHASTKSDSAAAHRAAAIYASRLLARYGRERAVELLRSGVPTNVVATLGQR
jgi:stage II sporulation protein D